MKIIIKDLSTFTNDPEDPTTDYPPPLNFMAGDPAVDATRIGIGVWVWDDLDGWRTVKNMYAAIVVRNSAQLIDRLGVGDHEYEAGMRALRRSQ